MSIQIQSKNNSKSIAKEKKAVTCLKLKTFIQYIGVQDYFNGTLYNMYQLFFSDLNCCQI